MITSNMIRFLSCLALLVSSFAPSLHWLGHQGGEESHHSCSASNGSGPSNVSGHIKHQQAHQIEQNNFIITEHSLTHQTCQLCVMIKHRIDTNVEHHSEWNLVYPESSSSSGFTPLFLVDTHCITTYEARAGPFSQGVS